DRRRRGPAGAGGGPRRRARRHRGTWRVARRTASDRVVSTVDPEARHVHRTVHHYEDGYKAHVVIEPVTGLICGRRVRQRFARFTSSRSCLSWALRPPPGFAAATTASLAEAVTDDQSRPHQPGTTLDRTPAAPGPANQSRPMDISN